MRTVVTGGAGFLGSALADHLQLGHDVHILDDLRTGDRSRLNASDIRTALRNLTKTFIPISETGAVYIPNPSIKWASEVIIVNRK